MQQQSPIHIKSPVFTTYRDPLRISWSKNLNGKVDWHDGKASVKFNANIRDKIAFDGREFHILQFHFHFKSEHWIEGKQYPMELHIVHQDCDSQCGELAVLGIMIDADRNASETPELLSVFESISKEDSACTKEIKTNPWEWLPNDTEHYFRYEGSLTTPDYDEIVSWLVFNEPLRLTRREINKLIQLTGEPARLPQPLCRRFVLSNVE